MKPTETGEELVKEKVVETGQEAHDLSSEIKSTNARGYEKEFFQRLYYLGKRETGEFDIGQHFEDVWENQRKEYLEEENRIQARGREQEDDQALSFHVEVGPSFELHTA